MKYILVLITLLVLSCKPEADPHGHPHDAQGGHGISSDGRPSLKITHWTGKTELFAEYSALTTGKVSKFATHITLLDHHKPIENGTVTVSLIKDGKGIRQTVDTPSSPGIFNLSLKPKEAGIYQLIFDVDSPELQEKIEVGTVKVSASVDEAIIANSGVIDDSEAISFLKEQAWKIDFQTVPVVRREIFEVVKSTGVWRSSHESTIVLTASTSGILKFTSGSLTSGAQVKKGQKLMSISSKGLTSKNLETEIENAKSNYDQAKAEFDRKKQLYESQIVPKAELEKAENRYRVTRSTYETLSSGYSSGQKYLGSPIDGYIKTVKVVNGDFVEEGESLAILGIPDARLLEAYIDPNRIANNQAISNIWYRSPNKEWSSMLETGGFIKSISKEVKADQPLSLVFAQINEDFPIGSFAEVQMAVGESSQSLLIPYDALLEDYGSYSIIAQLSGESFERRPVQIGKQNGNLVEVLSGLKEGDFVVTTGAYQVKMASMSGQVPAHGHVH